MAQTFKVKGAPLASKVLLLFVLLAGSFFFLSKGRFQKKVDENVLHLAIWGQYLNPELAEKFTADTGIRIKMTHYSSNEELLAKVQTGGSRFDVAVPSDYMVSVMGSLGLLETLEKSLVPNWNELDPLFLNQNFDPENKYSVPYAWTSSGIAIHRGLFKGEVRNWRALFENPQLRGQISALDDMRELAAASLKIHGHPVNSTQANEIKESFEYLKAHKNQLKILSANTIDLLRNKEILAGQVYSTDALMAQKDDPEIEFIIPDEGATQNIDSLVIIKNAPHKKAAHEFINFMITKESALKTALMTRSGPVVKGVRDLLPTELKKHKSLFPDGSVLNRLERLQDLKEKNSLYEEAWIDFKAH
jgi:spermidine/putrescine transport system substrate-binding protein